MIISQLPSLQEIYDFSSQDLERMAKEFNQQIMNGKIAQKQQTAYQQFIENIQIELEQRKTLEFFQQMCQVQNPYVKKVTDFNNEFLKLATQVLSAQESNAQKIQYKRENQKLQEIQEENYNELTQQTQDNTSVTSMNKINTNHNNFRQMNQEKAYSVTSQNHSTTSHEVKMGLKSNNKNKMKDFILSTLNKNKADGCYVVKKSGNAQMKPVPTFTVNERGHLVNPNSLQPIATTKSIKSSSKSKQNNTSEINAVVTKGTSSKNIMSEKEIQTKRQQALKKVNHIKSEKKKDKNLNNKDLVQMIRQQQRSKENKIKKESKTQKEEELPTNKQKQSKIVQEVVNKSQINKKQIKEDEHVMKQNKNITIQQKVSKQASNKFIPEQVISSKQALLQVQQPLNQGKVKTISQNEEICEIIEAETHEKEYRNIQMTEDIKQTIIQEIKVNKQDGQAKIQIFPTKQNKIEKNIQRFDKEMQELIKIKQEIALQTNLLKQQPENRQENNKQSHQQAQKEPFGRIIQIQDTENSEKQTQNTVMNNKKCYNEDYWIHIRQQAEEQIKRFKETKEIQQISKKMVKEQIGKSMQRISEEQQQAKRLNNELQGRQQENNEDVSEEKMQYDNQQDMVIQKNKRELAKMVSDHNKRKVTKKPVMAIMNPPKPLFALPTFNYLEIYPTFNHIFSVMYTKSEHQAVMDVPLIMKDLINMFSTHLNHFKDKNSFFKPALFLPFDTANSLQMTDPKQLLLHAQSTHVNLKKIVQRLQIFNENMHGQFNSQSTRHYRVIKTKEQVYDIISTGFLRRKGWKQLPHGCSLRSSWNLFWSWAKPDIDISKILVWQRINHFPFNKNLSRKDLLYKNLDSFRKLLKIQFDFLPLTFNLPKEFTQFSIRFHQEELINRDKNYWIMKPIGKSRGRGIKVINNLAELNYTDNIVVQKYIANPLLLDGYKFDMRIYVLVTNFHPLEAFVYKQGFARLSTQKYNLEPAFMKNAFIHLTNFAVNKNNEEAKQSAAFSGGSKISLKVLKEKLGKMNYSFAKVWGQVHEIIIKSLLGCSISVPSFPAAFQLFGYDIMIDTQSNCHLIEINSSPSLERSYLIDQIIKQSLIDDILDIVDPPEFDKQQLIDIMNERLLNRKKITPEQDLISIARVLKYQKLRKIGEMPQKLGLFQMIAPSKMSTDLQKLIKGRSGANNPKNID